MRANLVGNESPGSDRPEHSIETRGIAVVADVDIDLGWLRSGVLREGKQSGG